MPGCVVGRSVNYALSCCKATGGRSGVDIGTDTYVGIRRLVLKGLLILVVIRWVCCAQSNPALQQVAKRGGIHLFHYAGAMYVNGFFAVVKVAGNLLAGHSR